MNKIWGWMLIIGITVGLITGKSAEVSTALVESAKSGVNHAIGMAGVVAMWSGIMRLAEVEGLLDILTGKMEGLIHFLFPHIPKGHPAEKYISINFAANVLGLGWAATPAGLSAISGLHPVPAPQYFPPDFQETGVDVLAGPCSAAILTPARPNTFLLSIPVL